MLHIALCMRIWREVRNFAWHRWFSLQRCCKTFCFYQPALCRMCVLHCGLRAKIHYYCMWPFAKKLYHGWISTMTSSNEISWKFPPEMKSWLRPWVQPVYPENIHQLGYKTKWVIFSKNSFDQHGAKPLMNDGLFVPYKLVKWSFGLYIFEH